MRGAFACGLFGAVLLGLAAVSLLTPLAAMLPGLMVLGKTAHCAVAALAGTLLVLAGFVTRRSTWQLLLVAGLGYSVYGILGLAGGTIEALGGVLVTRLDQGLHTALGLAMLMAGLRFAYTGKTDAGRQSPVAVPMAEHGDETTASLDRGHMTGPATAADDAVDAFPRPNADPRALPGSEADTTTVAPSQDLPPVPADVRLERHDKLQPEAALPSPQPAQPATPRMSAVPATGVPARTVSVNPGARVPQSQPAAVTARSPNAMNASAPPRSVVPPAGPLPQSSPVASRPVTAGPARAGLAPAPSGPASAAPIRSATMQPRVASTGAPQASGRPGVTPVQPPRVSAPQVPAAAGPARPSQSPAASKPGAPPADHQSNGKIE